jgi:hypothetical protein
MTDFAQELRHRCRNPKCRMKLKVPVANEHHAFCTPGCHSSFYLKRCLVCENEKPAGRSDRKFCRRPRCRTKYAGNRDLFAPFDAKPVPGPVRPTDSSRSAHSTGIKSAHESDRPWRLVAAPKITAGQYHCATVADDPDHQWTDGQWRRIERNNRALLQGRKNINTASFSLPDSYVYSDWQPWPPSRWQPIGSTPRAADTDDLSIPDFLRRQL